MTEENIIKAHDGTLMEEYKVKKTKGFTCSFWANKDCRKEMAKKDYNKIYYSKNRKKRYNKCRCGKLKFYSSKTCRKCYLGYG